MEPVAPDTSGSGSGFGNHAAVWAAAAALVAGCALRAPGLGEPTLWYEEAVQWRAASGSWSDVLSLRRGWDHPPLYPLLLKGWAALAGDSVAALRAPSAAFGVATGMGLVLLVRRWHTGPGATAAAVAAGLLWACCPLAVTHAREVGPLALASLLALAGTAILAGLLSSPPGRWRGWAGYATLAVLLLYTQVEGAFVLAAHACATGLVPAARLRAVVTFALIAVAAGPWAVAIAERESSAGSEGWAPALNAAFASRVAEDVFTGNREAGPVSEFGPAAPLAVSVGLLSLCLGRGRAGAFVAALAVAPVAGLFVISAVTRSNRLTGHEWSCGLPFLLLGLAEACALIPLGGVRAAVLAAVLIGMVWVFPWPPAGRDDGLRTACDTIAGEFRPGDIVVTCKPGEFFGAQYYLRGVARPVFLDYGGRGLAWHHGRAFADDDVVSEPALARRGARRVWALTTKTIDLTAGQPGSYRTVQQWTFPDPAPYRGGTVLLALSERAGPHPRGHP